MAAGQGGAHIDSPQESPGDELAPEPGPVLYLCRYLSDPDSPLDSRRRPCDLAAETAPMKKEGKEKDLVYERGGKEVVYRSLVKKKKKAKK